MRNFKFLFTLILISLGVYIIFFKPTKLGLDLQGGIHLILEARPTDSQPLTEDGLLGSLEVIRNRIDALGLTEPVIRIKGSNQISVELPGVRNPEEAKKMVGDTALLEFIPGKWAPSGLIKASEEEKQLYMQGKGKLYPVVQKDSNGNVIKTDHIILYDVALTGADLSNATPATDEFGNPIVNLLFTSEGGEKFYQVTKENMNKPLAILLDGVVISAPVIQAAIGGGKAMITGSFSPSEVQTLTIQLNAGALPVPVDIISERQIGPTLGKDSIQKSKIAFSIGLVLISLFMFYFYKGPGFLASISLLTYIILSFSFFKFINATLTLPGIAGFILTMGMAVDSNVIIFERIKEELYNHKSHKAAILQGFKRAYVTILDANITTLIAAIVLFWLGSGTIKGFAITLSIGIIVSMFSAITITQSLLLTFPKLSHLAIQKKS